MKLIISILTLLLVGCNSDSNKDPKIDDRYLVIKTQDINGGKYPVSEVNWWYESVPESKYNLECDVDLCDTWLLPTEVTGGIYVESWHTVRWEDDEYCADVYRGEKYLYVNSDNVQELYIELYYDSSVCS